MRCRMNAHFAALPENYLFSTIRRRVDAYQSAHPEKRILSLGIGDVTRPLSASSVDAMCSAAQELSVQETFRGYPPDAGYDFLRDAICRHYAAYGVVLAREEIYCGDGAKSDLGNLTDIFGDNEVWIPDPVYPAYVDANVMAGRRIRYLQGGADTLPSPDETADGEGYVVYLCSPNNPTGALYSKEILEEIVKVAEEFGLIIFSDEIYDRLVMDGLKHISIASIAPKNVFCVTFSGLSKSHMIAGFRVGWMVLSGNKKAAAGYIEGIKMLSNMRLCSNVPAQSIIQTALGGYQSVEEYLQPGGRIYEQREVIYKLLNDIPGVSAKKPKAAFYIFPKLDVEKFNIYDDEKFALDLLREKRILIVHGGGFNWGQPDHFRVVYLPRIADLEKATKKLGEFLDGYHQK